MVNINDSLAVKPKSKRIFYFDALRAMAIIAVIVIHVFSETMVLFKYGQLPFHSGGWLFEDVLGVCFRFGVDLFLMLAKRLPRIVIPFLFWGFVLSSLLLIFTVVFPDFYWLHDQIAAFLSPVGFLKTLYLFYMAKAICSAPYWFFWMILGTYLIMPIFNKWLLHSDLVEAEYFLILWLIVCLFDYTLHINFPVNLTYFSSPIGFVILGYYLRHTKRRILNNPYFALALTLFSAALTIVLVIAFSSASEFYVFDRYSLLLALEIAGVFLLFKNFYKFNIDLNFNENLKSVFKRIILDIAKYSYGIYLIQGLFLCVYVKIVPYYEYYSNFISIFILIVLSSMVTMYICDKIPYICNIFIGSK